MVHLRDLVLAGMSHELRTPLNSIIGFSGVMLQGRPGPLTDEQRFQLEILGRAGAALRLLVDDLLDLERLEAGQALLCPEAVDVSQMVESVVSELALAAAEKGCILSAEGIDRPTVVVTDAAKVRQILRDLVDNAIKYSDGPRIVVSRRNLSEKAIAISVVDDGPGIAIDDLDRIFDGFVQLKPASRFAKNGGSGLGLAIAARLAESLGASLAVKSDVGRGSAFTLALPSRPGGPVPTV